jgi:outer membrane protein OmpA-like peptidoglycan-associated protein
LRKNPQLKIEIQGHTDSRGDATKNLQLSEARAKAVYEFLLLEGIAANRLTFKGYGSTQPIVSNAAIANLSEAAQIEAAHQKNRRTCYKIVP